MKPRNLRSETLSSLDYDTGEVTHTEKATISLAADNQEGLFFALGSRGEIIDLPIEASDAKKFSAAKSEKNRQKVLDKYVVRISKAGDSYSFPRGAFIGRVFINEALEINNVERN
jgi:hypothetical protein